MKKFPVLKQLKLQQDINQMNNPRFIVLIPTLHRGKERALKLPCKGWPEYNFKQAVEVLRCYADRGNLDVYAEATNRQLRFTYEDYSDKLVVEQEDGEIELFMMKDDNDDSK